MGEVMLHFEEALTEQACDEIGAAVEAAFGLPQARHQSRKPHMLFLPCDLHNAVPHAVLGVVRRLGYRAQLVDL